MPPNFSKDFVLYTFATNVSYVVMLTQINEEDAEIPVSFIRFAFKGPELNYTQVDKQDYTVYKFVKHSKPYLLKSMTKGIVTYTAVRNVLIQKELGDVMSPKFERKYLIG